MAGGGENALKGSTGYSAKMPRMRPKFDWPFIGRILIGVALTLALLWTVVLELGLR